jgi:hypothetical protein
VDAEVKLALERAQRDMAIAGGASSADVARLQVNKGSFRHVTLRPIFTAA